jgi:hypothetical protein
MAVPRLVSALIIGITGYGDKLIRVATKIGGENILGRVIMQILVVADEYRANINRDVGDEIYVTLEDYRYEFDNYRRVTIYKDKELLKGVKVMNYQTPARLNDVGEPLWAYDREISRENSTWELACLKQSGQYMGRE